MHYLNEYRLQQYKEKTNRIIEWIEIHSEGHAHEQSKKTKQMCEKQHIQDLFSYFTTFHLYSNFYFYIIQGLFQLVELPQIEET